MACVKIENVSFAYPYSAPVFDDFSCEITSGNCVHIEGISGAGKTTFFKILAGFIKAQYTTLELAEMQISPSCQPHKRDIAMVFQHTGLWQHMSVEKNIIIAAQNSSIDISMRQKWIHELLPKEMLKKKCSALSAGEQQRVEIIRACSAGKKILLLDEPFAFQDKERADALSRIIEEYCTCTNGTVLFTTHNEETLVYFPPFKSLVISPME